MKRKATIPRELSRNSHLNIETVRITNIIRQEEKLTVKTIPEERTESIMLNGKASDEHPLILLNLKKSPLFANNKFPSTTPLGSPRLAVGIRDSRSSGMEFRARTIRRGGHDLTSAHCFGLTNCSCRHNANTTTCRSESQTSTLPQSPVQLP